jgi:small GTP-binding protein
MNIDFKKLNPFKLFRSDSLTDSDDDFEEDAQLIDTNQLKNIIEKDNEDITTNTHLKENLKPEDIIIKPKSDLKDMVKFHKYKTGFKIIILGDSGVGKTSIFHALSEGEYSDNWGTTYTPDSIKLHYNNILILLNDTVGQEAYRSICQNYYREPQIVIFVFDINRMETFMNIPDWQQEVIKRNDPKYPIKYYLIANKRDLRPNRSLLGAKKFADENGMTMIVTSTKQRETIELLRNNIFQYVDENKDKGRMKLQDFFSINNVPKLNYCCNIN